MWWAATPTSFSLGRMAAVRTLSAWRSSTTPRDAMRCLPVRRTASVLLAPRAQRATKATWCTSIGFASLVLVLTARPVRRGGTVCEALALLHLAVVATVPLARFATLRRIASAAPAPSQRRAGRAFACRGVRMGVRRCTQSDRDSTSDRADRHRETGLRSGPQRTGRYPS